MSPEVVKIEPGAHPSCTLNAALLAFQAEAPALQRTALNPHFRSRYVPLDELMGVVLPLLNKHGIVLAQTPCRMSEDAAPALTTRLTHAESGEYVEGTMPLLLTKSDPQAQGAAITYARRYALMAMLGLVADEDDDGNAATPRATRRGARSTSAPAKEPKTEADGGQASEPLPPRGATSPSPPSGSTITDAQRKRLFAMARERGIDDEALRALILRVVSVHSTSAIPREKANAVFTAIEEWEG